MLRLVRLNEIFGRYFEGPSSSNTGMTNLVNCWKLLNMVVKDNQQRRLLNLTNSVQNL